MSKEKSKVMIITGAGFGVGAELAKHLSKSGVSLTLTCKNMDNLKRVAAKCKNPTLLLALDGDIELVTKKLINETIKRFNRLDGVIVNAGLIQTEKFETSRTAEPNQTNAMDHIKKFLCHLTKTAAPYLIQTNGKILNKFSFKGRQDGLALSVCDTLKEKLDQCTSRHLVQFMKELKSMKIKKIANTDMSYYDFYMKSILSLAALLRNKNLEDTLQFGGHELMFPLYSSDIESKFRMALMRKDLIQQCHDVSSLYLPQLPYNCLENIFSYLGNWEMRVLIAACATPENHIVNE